MMEELYQLAEPIEVFVPVIRSVFTFSLKESVQMPKLQEFILSAIDKYRSDMIGLADATRLPQNVIEIELNEMYRQKLLCLDNDHHYQLTDLSGRLLRYKALVDRMNGQSTVFVLNLVTGEIRPESEVKCFEKPEGLAANSVISPFQISGVYAPDIKQQLCGAFNLDMNDDLTDELLENIVIESQMTDHLWVRMSITHLSADENSACSKDCVLINNYMIQREYAPFDEYFENHQTLMEAVQLIQNKGEDLLNAKGLELFDRWKKYQQQKNTRISLYENPVNRTVYTGVWQSSADVVRKIMVDMNQFYTITSADDEAFEKKLAELQDIAFPLKMISQKKTSYISAVPACCMVYEIKEEI